MESERFSAAAFSLPFERSFDPNLHELYLGQASDIIVGCNRCPGCHIISSKPTSENPTNCGGPIVLSTDGACPNNGTPLARAAYGVFHGHDSRMNESKLISEFDPQTNQFAELSAAVSAVEQLFDLVEKYTWRQTLVQG